MDWILDRSRNVRQEPSVDTCPVNIDTWQLNICHRGIVRFKHIVPQSSETIRNKVTEPRLSYLGFKFYRGLLTEHRLRSNSSDHTEHPGDVVILGRHTGTGRGMALARVFHRKLRLVGGEWDHFTV